ncbi:hypothetical protein [Paraburkholderia sp. J8-2]|uniref:hypothetical protein n=1 Tax=Paraburkholderia sp. J8-2 TaxID=2805440 RepID=UPI002AB6CEA8|nr:hypothetical protein [Paraburkholderia sp. J8-2]
MDHYWKEPDGSEEPEDWQGPDDPAAKCYDIVRGNNPPIGFIWIACGPDEEIPEQLNVHIEYVFVVPAERGGMATWLADAVGEKVRSSLDSLDANSPITTMNSTSQPATSVGVNFVRRLNGVLKVLSQSHGFDFRCDEEYMPDWDAI